jgi:hypothetical protein
MQIAMMIGNDKSFIDVGIVFSPFVSFPFTNNDSCSPPSPLHHGTALR